LAASLPAVQTEPGRIVLSGIVSWILRGLDPSRPDACQKYSHVQVRALLLSLLQVAGETVHPQIRLAEDIVASSYADCTLNTLTMAQRVGLSPSHFGRTFKAVVGATFSTYLRHHRVTVSVKLLQEGLLSVKEIAARVGYKHVADFDRHFKLETGKCPTTIRLRRTSANQKLSRRMGG